MERQISIPGIGVPRQHGGAEVRFGTLTLDEADRQEMLAILETMGGPPY